MDFIKPLPISEGYDSILIVVDRLTKMSVFLPMKTTLTSPQLADLLIREIFTRHGLPSSIISDRGLKFVAKFWQSIMDKLRIKLNLSTAFHPQTNGQTEQVNQSVKHYLRVFTSYNQDDCSAILGQASFAYNNTYHTATKLTPFFANFGYHPRWVDKVMPMTETNVPIVHQIVEDIRPVHKQCQDNIASANERYSIAYNRKRRKTPEFKIGDLVMLSFKNITTLRPSKKLDVKWQGPFKIKELIRTHACRLELPVIMKNHNVFHVTLLETYQPRHSPTRVPNHQAR